MDRGTELSTPLTTAQEGTVPMTVEEPLRGYSFEKGQVGGNFGSSVSLLCEFSLDIFEKYGLCLLFL